MRTTTIGPEYDLVRSFVESRLPAVPKGQELTVFLEPRIESGFPDIVAVYWNIRTARSWSKHRSQLTTLDIRILHYLAIYGPAEMSQLKDLFSNKVGTAIERLYRAELVRRSGDELRAKALNSIFAVRRLIAIEAKISQWQKGLTQAFANTWFASESYLLVPHMPRSSPLIIEQAVRFGVGVAVSDQYLSKANAVPRRDRIPKSYASWLFNEWSWRANCLD